MGVYLKMLDLLEHWPTSIALQLNRLMVVNMRVAVFSRMSTRCWSESSRSRIALQASAGIVKKLSEPDFIEEEIVGEKLIELDKDSDNYDFPSSTAIKPSTTKKSAKNGNDITNKIRQAIEKGYTGDICTECQSMTMVRNGTCLKCMTCGSTSGCS